MKPKNKYTIDELYNMGFKNIGNDGNNHYIFHNSRTGTGYYMKRQGVNYFLGQTYKYPIRMEENLIRLMREYSEGSKWASSRQVYKYTNNY